MAKRIVIRCRYSGHYVMTDIEAGSQEAARGGSIFCPYCEAEHVWICGEPAAGDSKQQRRNPHIRQAG